MSGKIDPYIILERQWLTSLRPKKPTRFDPVFSTGEILERAHDGDSTALRLLDFNALYPSRRHWHHAVRANFGLECDDGCRPEIKRTYNGDSLIDRIKAAYRLEDVVGRLTYLHGTGDLLKGKCPLHKEQKGEAFAVRVDAQKWHCFGACGTGGDLVDFVRACKERGIVWNG